MIHKMKKLMAIILMIVIIAGSGVWYGTRERLFIPILSYHRIDNTNDLMSVQAADFEAQLRYLKQQGYNTITLEQVVNYLQDGGELPPKPIVITFDDGYEDNQRVAVPLLRKYGFNAIIFVITDNIGKSGYLTWQQMKDAQERSISIGSHSMTHADLTSLSQQELNKELQDSKTALEKGLGTSVDYMAYPFGRFNTQVVEAVQTAGYKGACSGKVGVNIKGANSYALRRIYIRPSSLGLWEFKLRLYRAQLLAVFN